MIRLNQNRGLNLKRVKTKSMVKRSSILRTRFYQVLSCLQSENQMTSKKAPKMLLKKGLKVTKTGLSKLTQQTSKEERSTTVNDPRGGVAKWVWSFVPVRGGFWDRSLCRLLSAVNMKT